MVTRSGRLFMSATPGVSASASLAARGVRVLLGRVSGVRGDHSEERGIGARQLRSIAAALFGGPPGSPHVTQRETSEVDTGMSHASCSFVTVIRPAAAVVRSDVACELCLDPSLWAVYALRGAEGAGSEFRTLRPPRRVIGLTAGGGCR
jgi:hypothetical protein